jgi:cob(I)alamin adenosyltransferase
MTYTLNVAVDLGLISVDQALELIEARPEDVELVLTGRNAPPEIVIRADLVTEMLAVKHPYHEGVQARRGIEY